MMPLLPRLLGRVDFRIMVIAGLFCFVISCMLDIHLTAQSVGHDFFWSQLIRGAGQMLVFMPLNQASMAAVTREEAGDAAGIYNMARNLGGSIGLAIIGTVIDRRNTFHVAAIRESLTANSLFGQERITAYAANWFAQTGDMAYSRMRALGQLAAQIQQQAMVITFSEVFYLLGIALLCCVPLALLLKTPSYHAPAAAGGH
jgi:DHA2 family multidrug resistance protein